MKYNLKAFHDHLKKVHTKSKTDVKNSYNELKQFIFRLDPIKLLSQLTLTYLFVPEGEFIEEGEEPIKWSRWIEFLTGCLITQPYSNDLKKDIDGRHLEKLEKLLDQYFRNLNTSLITSKSTKKKSDLNIERVIFSAKNYSLYVRGESYPHKLIELAKDLYSKHDNWFKQSLGFTIDEAIHLYKSITAEYNRRVDEVKQRTKREAKKKVNELIKTGKYLEKERQELEVKLGCYLYFHNSDVILSFTLEELSNFSKVSKKICKKYLNRLSQAFGYQNPNFKNTFQNAFSAPWDYNTVYERPLIHYEDKYFVPIPSVFPSVLFYTFHYDLIGDSNYENNYNEARGKWLEKRTANAFKKLFAPEEILLNPNYPDGTELADVLILRDRKIFIIQCKSKQLTYEAKIGDSFDKLKDDLEKGIKDAFSQASRARDYINNTNEPKILTPDSILVIDRKQVTDIFLVSVTLGHFQNLATRLANINPALGLFKDKEYPWAISIFDLEIINELIDCPSMFIHYTKQRLKIEQTNFELMADEIDLLGVYLEQGLDFKTKAFEGMNGVALSGFSLGIDRYMFEKYELGKDVEKPKQKIPQDFEDYIIELEKLDSSYKTDCIMRLLDLGYQGREFFVNTVEQTKEKTKNDEQLHSFSTVIDSYKLGFSFISMDAGGNLEKLFQQASSFAIMKKHKTKCKEWVGLGWDLHSKKKIDVAIFISYEWFDDPVLDQLSKKYLKESKGIDLKRKD